MAQDIAGTRERQAKEPTMILGKFDRNINGYTAPSSWQTAG
jgi:hypothetical protein